MLTLLLAAHDGGTDWRHRLAPGESRAGFEPVGPLGLVRRLGRLLGFRSEPAPAPERLAAYARRLDLHDDGQRSYSASRKEDPVGVARHLLALRDSLWLSGWDGRALGGSDRLRDLAGLEKVGEAGQGVQVAVPIPSGLPELTAELVGALGASAKLPVPLRIELASPRSSFEPLVWRLVEAALARGAELLDLPAPAPLAKETSDLGRLQGALLHPAGPPAKLSGDGSILLLEADTPIEAAELTASCVRARPLREATFVVATEPALLDAAVARQGLPTLGGSTASPLRPHLQVLPLRLALAFGPQDPYRAAELLLLPGAPLPGHARRALLEALGEMPGIGSPAWTTAIDTAVKEETERAAQRLRQKDGAAGAKVEQAALAAGAALRQHIDDWFGGTLADPAAGIPATRAAGLCRAVAQWAGARAAFGAEDGADDAVLWGQAAAVARTLEQLLVARPPDEKVAEATLRRLHDLAVGGGSELAAFTGEAGRPAIAASPASVTAPCSDVIWWGFVAGAGEGALPAPWTVAEQQALTAASVVLRGPGDVRALEAQGWRAPLLQARERLVLVRWRLAGAEPVASHSLLDELSTRVVAGSLERCTVTSERLLAGDATGASWTAATQVLGPLEPTVQRPVWTAPAEAIAPTGSVSATALEKLLGCPFAWALEHRARLLRGSGASLPEGKQLLGDFAHRILQDLLCGPGKLAWSKAKGSEARIRAAQAFDERVGREAAPLVERGQEVERDRARTLVAEAAASLVEFLKTSGWKPVDVEREVTGTFAGQPARGFIDLVVEKDGALAVIDLKLSGFKYRREALEGGQALQTALYATLLGQGGEAGKVLPPSGYFILSDGQMLTSDQAFTGATVVAGPGARASLDGAATAFRYWKKVLGKGLLPVLDPGLAWEEPVAAVAGPPPEEGTPGWREPPCRFCDYATVCGMREPAAVDAAGNEGGSR